MYSDTKDKTYMHVSNSVVKSALQPWESHSLQTIPFRKVVLEAAVLGEQGCTVALDRQNDRCTIHLKTPLVVKDDVKFMFYSSEVLCRR